jgi:hypothetical protein
MSTYFVRDIVNKDRQHLYIPTNTQEVRMNNAIAPNLSLGTPTKLFDFLIDIRFKQLLRIEEDNADPTGSC